MSHPNRFHAGPAGSNDAYLALLDAAKARAQELRTEAFDALWADADVLARRSLRAGTRFVQRLAHHARRRGASAAGWRLG